MSVKRLTLVVLGLILLTGAAVATDLSPSTISSGNTGWLVANGGDQSTITVYVMSSATSSVNNATVTFSVDDTTLGTIAPTVFTTGSDGRATAVFTVKEKSGTATIHAHIIYYDGVEYSIIDRACSQKIDHDKASNAKFTYLPQVTAGSVTSLNITLTDTWGNRIDNKNTDEVHTGTLTMSGDGGSGLWDGSGYVTRLLEPTDAEGNITVMVRVSTVAGSNPITMDPIGSISGTQLISIEGVSATPSYMSQTISSSCTPSTSCPADGNHPFNLYYTFLDQYQNPVSGITVLISSTQGGVVIGTPYVTTTDSLGIAYAQFTQVATGTYTLTARSESNSTIACTNPSTTGYCSGDVHYYSTAPVDMQLVVSPQMMVSRDVDAKSSASVMARVMDAAGNPVTTYSDGRKVTVTFSNSTDSFPDAPSDSPYLETSSSSLSATSADMGDDGFATVQFYPGTFVTYGQTGYNATATGQASVTALWTDLNGNQIQRTVPLIWKNYPYLSISSSASSTNAKVGDNLTVSVRIKGDGAALQPKPIDVLLLLDNSGSMGSTTDSSSRINQSQAAAINFINKMTQGKDRVGVIFYDKNTYPSPGFSVYVPLTYDLASVKTAINSYTRTAAQETGYHTRTRYALYEAITLMNSWNNRASVRAIIHMTDGVWSMEGDPLARGTGFDMSFLSSETDRAGLHSVWAGNLPLQTNMNTAPYRYFDDLGGGTAITGSRNDVPSGQLCDNTYRSSGKTYYYSPDSSSCTGWASDKNEATQLTTTTTLTYYTNAESSNQNMSVYAASSKIRIYSIGFGGAITGDISSVLSIISNSTGAYYQPASDSTKLNALYTQIAGDLNEQAGGNTQLVMNLDKITVDNATENVGNYLNYTYAPPKSTYVYKFNVSSEGTTKQDYYSYTRDDTNNWSLYKNLSFNVGTMKLNDVWETSFTFNLTHNGTLMLFGPGSGSIVSFTDASTGKTTTGFIPSLLITVRNSTIVTGLGGNLLLVDQLKRIDSGSADQNIVRIQWNTTYTGPAASGGGTVGETVRYYSDVSGSHWITYATQPTKNGPLEQPGIPDIADIDTSSWAAGTYTLEVYAVADNAPDSYATITYTKSPSGQSYIRLE